MDIFGAALLEEIPIIGTLLAVLGQWEDKKLKVLVVLGRLEDKKLLKGENNGH